MSAIWMRAQEFGQPLRWTVIGVSSSGIRCSSSATSVAARSLVSTMASLQNSMPVHAIVERRHWLGRADSPRSLGRGDQRVDAVLLDVEDDSFW